MSMNKNIARLAVTAGLTAALSFGGVMAPVTMAFAAEGAAATATGSVTIKNVTDNDDLMIITRSGLTIRMAVSDIRIAGRATQGVRLINIKDGDSIAAVSVVAKSDDEDEVTEAPAEQPVDGVSDGQGTPETSETPENEA